MAFRPTRVTLTKFDLSNISLKKPSQWSQPKNWDSNSPKTWDGNFRTYALRDSNRDPNRDPNQELGNLDAPAFDFDNALQDKLFEAASKEGKKSFRELRKQRAKTHELLKDSYVRAVIDHTKSLLGAAEKDRQRFKTSFLNVALRPAGGKEGARRRASVVDRSVDKWLAQLDKKTRLYKLFRLWFLDYHAMDDTAHIIESMDDNMFGIVDWTTLKTQLQHVQGEMKSITCFRHVDRIAKAREQLFTIADMLRRAEAEYIDTQRIRGTEEWEGEEHSKPPCFPSSMLRAVETNLLKAEVLSVDLLLRKVLLNGPQIQRDALRTLRKFDYKPNIGPVPPI